MTWALDLYNSLSDKIPFESINTVEFYLKDLDADKQERRCTQMWVKDGHDINENDHPEVPDWMDFLTASREAQYKSTDYTDSFYDPMTQEYIRKCNLTEAEKRKLRKHIRSGGRFCDDFFGGEYPVDYITYLREEKEYEAGMFDSYFNEWICKYGAEYLVRRHREHDFIHFLEGKEDYISYCNGGDTSSNTASNLSANTAYYDVQDNDLPF
jgi:hypothetical protein